MRFVIVMMKIDFTQSFNLQAKKYDWIKICYILQRVKQPISANQINYYFNRIFPQNYCNTQRIAQVIKQKKGIIHKKTFNENRTKITTLYYFSGEIILSRTTKLNWQNKSINLF